MPFYVAYIGLIRDRLRELAEHVNSIGLGHDLGESLIQLNDSLRDRPLEVGEPKYNLQSGMQSRLVVQDYLAAAYAVSETQKIVIVSKLTMLNRHPFPPGFEKYLNQ